MVHIPLNNGKFQHNFTFWATRNMRAYIPHSRTVKVNHHPFMRVKVKRISKLKTEKYIYNSHTTIF